MEIEIRDHRCNYDRLGNGPDLTLLHSVGLSTRAGWRYQIPVLATRFTVLSYDFRGLGLSERGREPLGVATFVRDLSALLRALGITQTVLMGVSLGGFVAQAFALEHPDMVKAMVLVSTACRIFPAAAPNRERRNEKIRRLGMAAAADEQLASHFSPEFASAHPEVMAWYRTHYLANNPAHYIAIMNDLAAFDSSDRVGTLSCPILVVTGGADQAAVAGSAPLESATILHRLLPGSELAVFPDAHHYPQLDHAEAFNARMLAFFNRASPQESIWTV